MFRSNIKVVLGCTAFLLAGQACTNLSENTYDVIPTENFGTTPAQQAALIGPLYSTLGDYFDRIISTSEVTTDAILVPTRGGDWKDGDEWKRMDQHGWDPTLDNGRFNGIWNWCYNAITSINQQLNTVQDEGTKAELRALRAFYHYVAMDHFGNVIIAEKAGSGSPDQKSRADVYAWVEKEWLEVYDKLSGTVGGAYYGRINKYVVDMMLAKLYLNAQVYTGTPQWQKAVDRTTNIIASGKYTLTADFLSNFSTQNQNSPETILAAPFDKSKRAGMNIQMRTLHYKNQLTYNLPNAPWNGYCTIAEYYNMFDDKDARKKMWLTGQQFAADGKPLDDDGVPLVFNPVIPSYEMPAGPTARLAGVRSQKYEIQKNNPGNEQDNDFIIFRLGDAYLMRGEANFRLGKTADALADINRIRARAAMPNYTTVTLDEILAERGRELAWEGHRRQDLIRFGQYTKAWLFKPVSPETRNLFPIPKDQIALNPKLKQNPGYN